MTPAIASAPAPFTGEVLRVLHHQARLGTPPVFVAKLLCWDLPRLARAVRDHGVDMQMPEEEPPPAVRAVRHVKRFRSPLKSISTARAKFVTISLKPVLAEQMQAHAHRWGIARAAIIGAAVAMAMSDPAATRHLVERASLATRARREPIRGSGYESAKLSSDQKLQITEFARAHGQTISWMVNTILEYVTANDLWDRVMDGEAVEG